MGRFRVTELLGRGGMAQVYRAQDVALKRYVALKVVGTPEDPTKAYRIDQFLQEARSAAILDHPNVVQIYEVGRAEPWHFIAMELVEGGNLEQLIRAAGPLEPHKATHLLVQAAEALAYAHRTGVVHRDLKPANLMLTRAGHCKITDFGLADLYDPSSPFRLPNEAVGTPLFAAPELSSTEPLTAASDVYSLGCTAWFLLTGAPPFDSSDRKLLLEKHRSELLPHLSQIRPEVSQSLADTIHAALSKEPADRPTMEEFGRRLRAETIGAGGDSVTSSSWRSGTVYTDELARFAEQSSAWAAASEGSQSPMGASRGMRTSSGSSGFAVTSIPEGRTIVVVDPKAEKTKWMFLGVGMLAVSAAVVLLIFFLASGGTPEPAPIAQAPTPQNPPAAIPNPVAPIQSDPTPSLAAAQQPRDVEARPAPTAQPNPPVKSTATPSTPPPSAPPARINSNPSPSVSPSAKDTLTLADRAKILELSKLGSRTVYTFEGTVVDAAPSSTGRVFQIHFEPANAKPALYCAYFPDMYPQMQQKFGGKDGDAIKGKKIRVTGRIDEYRGTPQIVINNPSQITIIE